MKVILTILLIIELFLVINKVNAQYSKYSIMVGKYDANLDTIKTKNIFKPDEEISVYVMNLVDPDHDGYWDLAPLNTDKINMIVSKLDSAKWNEYSVNSYSVQHNSLYILNSLFFKDEGYYRIDVFNENNQLLAQKNVIVKN